MDSIENRSDKQLATVRVPDQSLSRNDYAKLWMSFNMVLRPRRKRRLIRDNPIYRLPRPVGPWKLFMEKNETALTALPGSTDDVCCKLARTVPDHAQLN
jgi:hypothetical protein